MAASSYEIIKVGDTKRILYSAKDFKTGGTVAAVPYNPSNAAQTAINFTEIGATGVYYSDWDSTGKAQGVWSFIVTEDSKKMAVVRVQVIDGDSMNDTIWEKLDTMLDSITSSLSTMDGKIDIIDGNVDDIEALAVGSDGFSAIKTVVDAINVAVGALDNNADAKIALIDQMLIPVTLLHGKTSLPVITPKSV